MNRTTDQSDTRKLSTVELEILAANPAALKRAARPRVFAAPDKNPARAIGEAADGDGNVVVLYPSEKLKRPPASELEAMAANGADATTQALLDAISVVKEKKAASAAASYEHRPKKKGHWTNPTPERVAHASLGIEAEVVIPGAGPVPDTNRHRVVDYVTKFRADLTPDEEYVFEWVRDLAETHLYGPMTINYGGVSSGGHPSQRNGGVSDRLRAKFAMFEAIGNKLRWTPNMNAALQVLVLNARFDDRPMDPLAFAKKLFPLHTDKSFLAGAARMALKLLAEQLQLIQVREAGLTRRPSSNHRMRATTMEPVK